MAAVPFRLDTKNILVTGASSGIGKAIATVAAAQGASVCLTARDTAKLEAAKATLEGDGHRIFSADLGNVADLEALTDQLPELNGVVLNAGMVKTVPVRFMTQEDIQYMFAVNVQGSMQLVQKLLKKKKIAAGGSICFISSIATQKITLGNAMYSATKGAVNSFAKALALEMAPKGIRSNVIMPGFVETNILEESSISADQLAIHQKKYPIGRFGRPEDVAHLALYLLADESSWMTGSLLPIDGGYSL